MQIINSKFKLKDLIRGSVLSFFDKNFFKTRYRTLRCIFKMLRCGTGLLGQFIFTCKECGYTKKINVVCKNRLCISCGKPLSDKWMGNLLSRIPTNLKYYHITFTIPKELRGFLKDHRATLNLLFKAVTKTINDYFLKEFNGKTGIVSGIHTYGSDLKRNPHIHILIPIGYLTIDNTQRIDIKEDYISYQSLNAKRKYNLITMLRKRANENLKKANYYKFYSLSIKVYDKSWYVKVKETFDSFEKTIAYIGRYLKKPIISETRIKKISDNSIEFEYYKKKPFQRLRKIVSKIDFIGFVFMHLPQRHFRCIRYSGIFSQGHRKKYIDLLLLLTKEEKEPKIIIPQTYKERMITYFGIDPFLCPICKSEMVLTSAIFYPTKEQFLDKYNELTKFYKYKNSS